MSEKVRQVKEKELLANLKRELPRLRAELEEVSSHWGYEDPVYRFYYHSFKVYPLQEKTRRMAALLASVAPHDTEFCPEFKELLRAGAEDKVFRTAHNRNWTKHTRPMIEAFFHARFFLEMAVKYGAELREAPQLLPSGWAALLCLYQMR